MLLFARYGSSSVLVFGRSFPDPSSRRWYGLGYGNHMGKRYNPSHYFTSSAHVERSASTSSSPPSGPSSSRHSRIPVGSVGGLLGMPFSGFWRCSSSQRP